MPKNKRKRAVALDIPGWVSKAYVALAVALTPWTVYLSITLPHRHLSGHWSLAWVGFDVALIGSMLVTGILAWRRSLWLVCTATMAGSALVIDAWFDIMSATGLDFGEALVLAVCAEIPLALLSFTLAFHALKRLRLAYARAR